MTTWWLPFTSLLCLASSCLLLPRWNKLITILWNLNSILKFLQQEEDIYPYTFQIRRNPNLSSLFFNLTQAMRTLASRKREIWPFEEEIWQQQQHIFILWSGHWKKRQRFTTINRMKLPKKMFQIDNAMVKHFLLIAHKNDCFCFNEIKNQILIFFRCV